MKKKLLTIILVLALSVTVILAFTACDLFSRGGNGTGGNGGDVPKANYDHFYIEDNEVVGLTALGAQQTILVVPASVTAINRNAREQDPSPFRGMELLHPVTVKFEANSNLEVIGNNSFFAIHALESITIPASVTRIGMRAFNSARGLHTVIFEPNSRLESIAEGAFFDTPLLESITIPASVTSIGRFNGSSVFGAPANNPGTGLRTINFEANSSLRFIGDAVFSRATNLQSITILRSVETIGRSAFSGWTQEQTIYVQGRTEDEIPHGWTQASGFNSFTWISGSNANLVWGVE
ncbi:MAG: leucine-rich repeat domain-containing protein [Defluviitaleaceae bacterium]|nr:leucine-rich repeat domain-containing protein [Defluviitaleaceae bacterium]